MVLKINNNLITPSHIIEGEKVNDTYFEGKYHLMLPNSEERYLTSVSERKQLLNESLRSNLYDRKTRGTIVSNTTTGKMFDEEIISENIVTVSNFSSSSYFKTNKILNKDNSEIIFSFEILPNSDISHNAIVTIKYNDDNSIVFYSQNNVFNLWLTSSSSSITSSETVKRQKYFAKIINQNGFMKLFILTNNTWKEILSASIYYDIKEISYGTDPGFPFAGKLCINDIEQKSEDIIIFNGKTAVKGVDYTVVGNPTITKETITTRTATQKPFNQSVTINSSEIQEGTKYLVDYPGMFQIKTEDNTLAVKFLFEDEPVWKYIKQEELVEGDNVLSLVSDTEKLKFIVNSTEHILVDSTITEEQKYIVNGKSNNYIQLNVFDPQDLPWEIETFAKYGSAVSSYSKIMGGLYASFLIGYIDSGSSRNMGLYLSSNGSRWDIYGSSYFGKYLELNKNYYYKLVFDGSSYKYYYKEENANEYTLIVSVNSSTKIYKDNIVLSGAADNTTTNENTKVNITKTKIKINGEVWFDGATAVEGVDYTIVGSPTIETETIHVGGEIPELTAGYLGYREGWKLKQGE